MHYYVLTTIIFLNENYIIIIQREEKIYEKDPSNANKIKKLEAIKNQFKNLSPTQSISKFLINQSVGKSEENVLNILVLIHRKTDA